MIHLCRMEAYKLWHRRPFLILVLFLLISNITYVCYHSFAQDNARPDSYRMIEKRMAAIPNNQRYQALVTYQQKVENSLLLDRVTLLKQTNDEESKAQLNYLYEQHPTLKTMTLQDRVTPLYTQTLEQELLFLQNYRKEMDVLHQYSRKLKDIEQRAKTLQEVSIFQQKESFSQRNIQKTAKDYAVMQHTSITYTSEKGILEALSPVTGLLLIIAIFAIATYTIMEEKERNLFSMIRITPNGQIKTILAKSIVLTLSILVLCVLFYGVNLLIMDNIFGLHDLTRSLQSLASFHASTLSINVASFLILFILFKWITLTAFAGMIHCISLLCNNRYLGIAISSALILIGAACTLLFNANGPMQLLHYCNFYTLIQSEILLQQYMNLNILGYPISLSWIASIFVCVTSILSYWALCLVYLHKQNLQYQPLDLPFPKRKQRIHPSLLSQEFYKLFWLQKASVVILLFILFQYVQYHDKTTYFDQNERFTMHYLEVLKGPYTAEKQAFLNREETRFKDLHEQMELLIQRFEQKEISKMVYEDARNQIELQLQNEEVFRNIQTLAQHVKADHRRQFVIPYGHQQLLQSETYTLYPGIFLMIAALFAFSNLFPYDYRNQMQNLISVSVHGHTNVFIIKALFMLFGMLLLYAIAYLPGYISLAQHMDIRAWNASITSLPAYQQLSSAITIGQYYVLVNSIRFFAMLCFAFLCSYFAMKQRQQLAAIFFGTALFIFPLLLHIIDVTLLDNVSFLSFLIPNFQVASFWLCLFLYGTLALFAFIQLKRHHDKS